MNRITTLLVLLFTSFALSISAQTTSAADKLYSQGVTYMKTMTVASQKKAITAFGKAKVAYDSKSKKDLCDEQIAACNNIIKKLSASTGKRDNVQQEGQSKQNEEPVEKQQEEVTLSASPSTIEFTAKGGKYAEISVDCNMENWEIESSPTWVTFTSTKDKIFVKAEKNKEKGERVGVVTIKCKNKKAEVVLKQVKGNLLDVIGI